MNYKITLTDEAKAHLISLDGTRSTIARRIEALKESPEKQGKALSGDLVGYRSLHAAGRYRVLYEVKVDQVMVIVVAAGMRKEGSKIDVYETLKKLLRSKVFE
ncbi:MAG: type II toxin-antitoxin system RelE/ParE family toxin [Deltaproteobacteria bacterium]|nr:type II toxin-antitoxin system RelE/ParE family toxin [Deltaproteobacteria bacterium]